MSSSLFIEQRPDGLAFYLNGDLQFDTADEAIYHEYLVIPPIALAAQRFPQVPLRVLICGGGDGLAAREVQRFATVDRIDLVDYSAEVLELGQTVFQPFNRGSLTDDRITLHTAEAFAWVAAVPDRTYHAILCDFTYPTSPNDTAIYSQEWFQQLQRVLIPGGLISTNGVSPENRTLGFWCLYQTLLAAGLTAKPLHLVIPSFQRHGYGNWGFLLASDTPIQPTAITELTLPPELQTLTLPALRSAFEFPSAIAQHRHLVNVHTLRVPQLFYYLLNAQPPNPPETTSTDEATIDFLTLIEPGTGLVAIENPLGLEATARAWLEQLYRAESAAPSAPDLKRLLPLQHRYQHPRMAEDWLAYLRQLLAEIDLTQLISSLLARAQELPPKVVQDLRQLAAQLRSGQALTEISPRTAELIMLLSATLLMANLITPDAVFAKGYSSSSGSGYYSDDSPLQFLGFVLTVGGIAWLYNLYSNDSNRD